MLVVIILVIKLSDGEGYNYNEIIFMINKIF